jgi:hypothetical protein
MLKTSHDKLTNLQNQENSNDFFPETNREKVGKIGPKNVFKLHVEKKAC